jgi:dolichol kinase
LLIGYSQFSDNGLVWQYVVGISLGATLLENVASLGFDNLLVPLAVGLLLQTVA